MDVGGNFHGIWEQSGSRSQQYNAQIQNHYHRDEIEKEEIPRTVTPLSTIPFLRDPNFVERLEYRQIDGKLSSGRTRVALTGFGGAGKSQLAIEYCYRKRESSPDCWVFWVHASSPERLNAGIREIANVLQLPGRRDANADMLQLVGGWLRGSGKQWLLVLDNADNEDVLFQPLDVVNGTAQKRMIDFLAIPSHGQTVLTTRYNKVASQFVDDCDIITVGPMTKSDAIDLFRKKAGEHHDATDIEELVGELGYIPLAIAHAAAFIKRKVPLCTVQSYLEELRKTIGSDASLLTANYNELRRDGEAINSAINTWQVSFEHIRLIRPSAADCLSLMSFYDHRSIPRWLLCICHTDAGLTDQYMPTHLDEDVLMLYEFHLISIGVGNKTFELHALVQLAARKWLQWQKIEEPWLRKSILNLRCAFVADSDYSSKWLVLLPHFRLVLKYEPEDEASGLCLADACDMASRLHTYTLGVLEPVWAKRCWAERTHHLGESHIETLHAELGLARLLVMFGKAEEAQSMLNHCLMLAEKHSHSNREWKDFHVECLHVMGEREASQEKLTDAECYFRKALDICDKHPEIIYIPRCVGSLKDVLLRQKKQSEAETVCRQALNACIGTHGSEHEFTMELTSSLADVLFDKGNLVEALEMYNDVSEGYKHISVPRASTLAIELRIARTLMAQKKIQEAKTLLFQMSMDPGLKNIHLVGSIAHTCAVLLKLTGETMQALDLMKACARATQGVLGPDHKDAMQRLNLVSKWEREIEEEQESQVVHEQQDECEQQGRKRKRDECEAE